MGRITGNTGTPNNHDNNHAFNRMALYSDARYDPRDPALVTRPIGNAGNDRDGLDAGANFQNAAFWEGLGFTTTNGWDTTTAANRRHPVIRGLAGQ